MNESELLKTISAKIHSVCFRILAPNGFKIVHNKDEEVRVSTLDFVTEKRIQKLAVNITHEFFDFREHVFKSLEGVQNKKEVIDKINTFFK